MRIYYLILLINISGLLSGCTLLPFRNDSKEVDLDPVATVARQYRDPAATLTEPESFSRTPVRPAEETIRSARENGQLVAGMAREDVLAVWGEPRDVEVAGFPGMGYERWIYFDGLSSPWSLSTSKVIYFEKGLVSGWETAQP